MEAGTDTRPPRGALAVVAVALLATIAAALLSTDKPLGATELEWVEKAPLPDSRPAAVPGGGRMRLVGGGLRATEYNAGGYRLYRVAAVLRIGAGSATGQGRLRCATRVPRLRTLIAHTPNSRADFPRSSSGFDLRKQGDPPDAVQVEFNSHGGEYAIVELGDAFPRYTTSRGVLVSWTPFREGVQEWQWGLPRGRPARPLELGFASLWRTTGSPTARTSCRLETSAGTAAVRTAGSLAE